MSAIPPFAAPKRYSNRLNLKGKRFGRWTVLAVGPTVAGGNASTWVCRCDCGLERLVLTKSLRNGRSQSCGCVKSTEGLAHGHCVHRSTSKAYRAWCGLLSRCTNPNYPGWHNYGGRGIKVAERWKIFQNFYADMGDAPPGTSIDRIDNNGDYAPGNCRWATFAEQCRNRRTNVTLLHDGVELIQKDWLELHPRIREEHLRRWRREGLTQQEILMRVAATEAQENRS